MSVKPVICSRPKPPSRVLKANVWLVALFKKFDPSMQCAEVYLPINDAVNSSAL